MAKKYCKECTKEEKEKCIKRKYPCRRVLQVLRRTEDHRKKRIELVYFHELPWWLSE